MLTQSAKKAGVRSRIVASHTPPPHRSRVHGKGGDGVAAHVSSSSGNGLVRVVAVAEAMKCYIARPDPKQCKKPLRALKSMMSAKVVMTDSASATTRFNLSIG